MYRGHSEFLELYRECLKAYREKYFGKAKEISDRAEELLPDFITEEYMCNHKSRLYTKDSEHYKQFKGGLVDYNMYFIDGQWRYYRKGKQIVNV